KQMKEDPKRRDTDIRMAGMLDKMAKLVKHAKASDEGSTADSEKAKELFADMINIDADEASREKRRAIVDKMFIIMDKMKEENPEEEQLYEKAVKKMQEDGLLDEFKDLTIDGVGERYGEVLDEDRAALGVRESTTPQGESGEADEDTRIDISAVGDIPDVD